MIDRDHIVEVVQQALADVLGVCEADVTVDARLQDDLALDTDDLEDVVAYLQSVLEIHIAPDELFPEDMYDQLTVHSLVNTLERRTDNS